MTDKATNATAGGSPLDGGVRPRAWMVRRADWPAAKVECYAGERPPQWATSSRPLYFVDDLDDAVAAERERCAKLCDAYESGGQDWAAIAAGELAREIRGA